MLIGVTDHTPRRSGPAPYAAQVLRYHDLNARAARPAVQAADLSCDWSELRPFVDWHVARGMVGVHVMGGTPAWDTDSTEPDGYGRPGGAAVPRTWDGLTACIRSFCVTFSPEEVPYLSPWNEPFGPRSFDGGAAELVEAQRILRTEAPDRTILTPSFYNIEHARAFIDACPRDLWDVLDLHLYGQTAEQLMRTLAEYRALAPGCRIALTELGWDPRSQTQPADAPRQDWKWPLMSRQQRAGELLRIYRALEACGFVDMALWYSVDGFKPGDDPDDDKSSPIYSMGNRPELLAAQRAAVERKDMATTPTTAELLAAALASKQQAQGEFIAANSAAVTLLGQVRAYLTTVLATNTSGGGMTPDQVQGLLDMISQDEVDTRAATAATTAAIAANQLPTTAAPPTNTPPPPPVGKVG